MSITNTTFSAFGGTAAPAVSAAGTGRLYFDSTTNTFRISEDGSPYSDIATKAWVEALMDYSNAVVDKPVGFVSDFKSAALAGSRCVDIDYQIRGEADVSLFLQIHDIGTATPVASAEAIISRAVSALDGDTWEPVGTWGFALGIFIGLSTTDRIWTPAADQYLFPVVRYLP